MRSNLPKPDYFIGKSVPTRPDLTITSLKASGNDGHLFRAHSSDLGRDVACKIIPQKNLQHSPDGGQIWRGEVYKANALKNPIVVNVDDIREWPNVPMVPDASPVELVDCIALISEFVEGISLRSFIKDHPDEITVPFISRWLETLLNLLYEMDQKKVAHGDLHAGNIIVEDRSSFDLMGPRYVFRVTDFGVGDTTSEPRFKDDYHQLADTLAQLLGVVSGQVLRPKDKFIFGILRDHFLSRHLIEMDTTLDSLARQPKELIGRLRELDREFEQTTEQNATRLLTPFDFLSCEQIGESAVLLRALYSDRFLGLSEIESQNNVVVTGPRGCGKSTVFRSLSLDQRMRVDEAQPEQTTYLSVYYRCDDLYFAFPRYTAPSRQEAVDIPVHFVTATLFSKLIESLENWARQYFAEEFNALEARVVDALWSLFGIPQPRLPGSSTLKAIVSALNKERLKASERQRFVNDSKRELGSFFGADMLQKACEILGRNFSFVRERPIYFFIDDYSSPKVTKELQASLNRVFMQRTSFCFFKISTESPVSFAKHDIDEKIYVESREFILQNLGLVYLRAELAPKLTFVEDVFRRRLTQSVQGFPAGELEELVGSNADQNNNELARGIRVGEKPQLWGKETLCSLCSGDIHYLISLVGDMVRQSGGPEALGKEVGPFRIQIAVQNRAIRESAGSFLKNLRGIPRCGDQLVSIVEAFGNVANSHLKFLNSRNEGETPPKQATRIEPYEPFLLSEKAQRLYDELLRYSVFIEDYRGKSRRGKVVPRLFLRRFLIPHFNLTFSTRDSIELEARDFETFLMDPAVFEQKLKISSPEDADRHEKKVAQDESQLSLGLEKFSQ